MTIRAPYIWFGGKRRVAPIVWRAFGDPPNYVEPFFGSGAVLLGRSKAGKIETINDINADVANFWRAVQHASDEVASFADGPVNEADLHARHRWLLDGLEVHRERMMSEPEYFDAKRAGWWVWGLSCWIGQGWCEAGRTPSRQLPFLSAANSGGGMGVHAGQWRARPDLSAGGRGIHSPSGRMPSLGTSGRGTHGPEAPPLQIWFQQLRERLRYVRVACGDWSRIVSGAVTGASNTRENMGMTPCGVFLDPPYEGMGDLYGTKDVAEDVRQWAVENGDNRRLRIALCGYEGQEMPPTWTVHAWKAPGGYGNRHGAEANENSHRERIWFSPHCLSIADEQPSLFG